MPKNVQNGLNFQKEFKILIFPRKTIKRSKANINSGGGGGLYYKAKTTLPYGNHSHPSQIFARNVGVSRVDPLQVCALRLARRF